MNDIITKNIGTGGRQRPNFRQLEFCGKYFAARRNEYSFIEWSVTQQALQRLNQEFKMTRQMPTILRIIFFFTLISVLDSVEAVCTAQTLSTGSPADAPMHLPASNQPDSVLLQRQQEEKRSSESRFSILPHKTNYLLPFAYNTSPNKSVYAGLANDDDSIDSLEAKFQLSIKTPLWDDIVGDNGTLYIAYSQIAFWQAYNSGYSSPFREINFEPESFLSFKTDYEFMGLTCHAMTIGFNHQSNGRSKPLSRSWNRIIANLLFGSGNTFLNFRPWFRIPEDSKDDDNPRMEKYYGYGELAFLHKLNNHTFAMILRNNLRTSGNKGAIQLDWSFPLHKKLQGYVQFFNGYGESLVDYNHSNNRIGVGVMLTDWL